MEAITLFQFQRVNLSGQSVNANSNGTDASLGRILNGKGWGSRQGKGRWELYPPVRSCQTQNEKLHFVLHLHLLMYTPIFNT